MGCVDRKGIGCRGLSFRCRETYVSSIYTVSFTSPNVSGFRSDEGFISEFVKHVRKESGKDSLFA